MDEGSLAYSFHGKHSCGKTALLCSAQLETPLPPARGEGGSLVGH